MLERLGGTELRISTSRDVLAREFCSLPQPLVVVPVAVVTATAVAGTVAYGRGCLAEAETPESRLSGQGNTVGYTRRQEIEKRTVAKRRERDIRIQRISMCFMWLFAAHDGNL